jgi:TonB family protein
MIVRGIFCLIALVPAAAAAQLVPKQPTGKWVVDYADKMCVLQRDYGTRAAPLVLAIRPQPMGDGMGIYVLDAPTGQRGEYVGVKIGFGATEPTVDSQMATFDARDLGLRVNETGLDRHHLERALESNLLTLEARKRLNVSFSVPKMAPALKVLDDCVANLLETWGFTRERQATMAKRPEPLKPEVQYVGPEDYPDEALRAGESGQNSARYWIDVQGRVSNCTIVETSKSRSLDSTLCRVVKRIRYRPALEKSGKPMESIGYLRLRWSLG